MASTYFDPPGPRVLAHRGLAIDVPENSLLAFGKAAEAGAAYVETDVHVSFDGVAVIAHDPTLKRVAGRDVPVAKLTMGELRRIDLGHGQGFCSLEEALDGFRDVRFNIDVKAEGAVPATVAAVRRTTAARRVLLTSFSDARRRRLGALVPEAVTSAGREGVVRALRASYSTAVAFRRALRGAIALQVPEGLGGVRIVTPRFVDRAHAAGVEVHVWTVNEPERMTRLLDLGVDGLVTDRADLAVPLVAARI